MAPKRKNNSNKKRRPKTDKPTTPNLTPDASPSKVMNDPTSHSPATTPTDHSVSTPTGPTTDKNHSIQLDHTNDSQEQPKDQSIKHHTQRPVKLPESKPKSDHHHSTEPSGQPTKPASIQSSAGKQNPADSVDRVQDNEGSTENSANPTAHSKVEARKASDPPNKPTSNNHAVDRDNTQPQRPADRVLKEITDHNNPTNSSSEEPKSHPPPKSLENTTKSPNHHSNHVKKPIKQVKFTNNVKNEESTDTSTQENHRPEQNTKPQANHEPEKKSSSKNKHIAIRREMSGATDQFDFDAQQRQHAGPGGGMVKKPRHSQTNRTGSNNSTPGEPNQVTSDSSPNDSHQEPNHPSKPTKGFHHAKQCLQSMAQTQTFDQLTELDPDLLQIYLSYFDQNQDGLLDPVDTWRAVRRLGFGLVIATMATIALHAMMIPFIRIGGLKSNVLGLCHLPIGHRLFESTRNIFNITATNLSRFVCIDRKDHHYPDRISPSILWKETREHIGGHQMTDPIGWLRFVFGWIIAIALTRPSDFTVKYDLIDGVYSGEILFLVAQDSSS